MVNVNLNYDYFDYVRNNPDCKVIMYGAGYEARKNYKYFDRIDYFCDQKAKSIELIENIPCLLPEELVEIQGKMIIIICIRNKSVAEHVCLMLGRLPIDAEVFCFFDNPACSTYDDSPYLYHLNAKDKLKICIVSRNDDWILGKFTRKLQEELCRLGQEAYISSEEDPEADINHYVHFEFLSRIYGNGTTVRTTMITHSDCLFHKERIKYHAQNGVTGICMSSYTLNMLSICGIPRDKLCYVNPAHDGDIKPRKIVIGITYRCHSDYDLRKRDDLILQVCKQLDACFFKLRIMGDGWDETVSQLEKMGFEVDYYPDFDREIYKELMPSLDYWFFSGFDEGGMGYLDALAAGVKTIVTPQGFHLDAKGGLTYPCSTIEDFTNVLKQIQEEKRKITEAVKGWTWENYAKKHLEIWQYLTRSKPLKEIYLHQSEYMDGIFSLLICDSRG